MWYKYEENNDKWVRGYNITLPSGEKLTEAKDGWFWSEEEPQEYLDWKEAKEIEDLRLLNKLEK